MNASASKSTLRTRRHARIRAKVSGTSARPRLAIFKSNRFISVQLIDDEAGKTVASVHGREFKGSQGVQAKAIGEAVAKKASALGVTSVVFDRGGYPYAGQIKALAEAARAGGLAF